MPTPGQQHGKNIRPDCEHPSRRDETSATPRICHPSCVTVSNTRPRPSRVAQQSLQDIIGGAQTLVGNWKESPHHKIRVPEIGPVDVTIDEKVYPRSLLHIHACGTCRYVVVFQRTYNSLANEGKICLQFLARGNRFSCASTTLQFFDFSLARADNQFSAKGH
jgi:hypothetical protein